MDDLDRPLPQPKRRLWNTRLRRPRKVTRLAPPIAFAEVAATLPDGDEAAHWGEVSLLSDDAMLLHRDGTVTTSHHTVTMLCGDENLAAWDEIASQFDRYTRVTIRCARTYLPDGRTLNGMRNTHRFDQAGPYGPAGVITISFPFLRPGTVVDWDYQEDYFRPSEIASGTWGEYFLQTLIPCRRRRVTVGIARPFTATVSPHNGAQSPTEFELDDYHVYQWDLHDVAALEVDNWVPAARDFAPWVDVSTLHSWQPIINHYQRELQPEIRTPAEVKQLVKELTQDSETDTERAFQIHQFVARDVRYGRHPHESAMVTSRDMGRMMVDLRGDCKDKSAMLVSMLREISISAKVAVVLTNDCGFRRYLPSGRFNHAIVVAHVDGEEVWIDAAAGPYTYGDTPSSDQGVLALLLDGPNSPVTEVPATQPADHSIDRVSGGSIDSDGNYCFQTLVTATGDRAAALRDALRFRAQEHRQSLMTQSVAADHPAARVDDMVIENIDDLIHPPRYKYRITLPAWGRRIESLLLLRMPWFEPLEGVGLFAVHERSVPLAAPHPCCNSEFHTISLPDGYSGYGLPIQRSESVKWATYDCRISVDDGRLQCERRVEFRGGIVAPEEFVEFKRFWEACVRWDREDVVLIRETSPLGRGSV